MCDDALRRKRLSSIARVHLSIHEEQEHCRAGSERGDGDSVRPRDVAAPVKAEQEREDGQNERDSADKIDATQFRRKVGGVIAE